MYRNDIITRINQTGIMAIVRVETEVRALEIAEGCLAGGVDCLEISYTLPNAGDIIKFLTEKYGDRLLVGAGTVLDSETARLAILAGAKFIIAPNYQKRVCELANRYQIPYMPGCSSVTEMITAMEAGSAMVKAFPISSFYGASLITTFKTPTPYMPIMSSGGVTLANVAEWVATGVECMGVGSLLTRGTQTEIAENARVLVAAVKHGRGELVR